MRDLLEKQIQKISLLLRFLVSDPFIHETISCSCSFIEGRLAATSVYSCEWSVASVFLEENLSREMTDSLFWMFQSVANPLLLLWTRYWDRSWKKKQKTTKQNKSKLECLRIGMYDLRKMWKENRHLFGGCLFYMAFIHSDPEDQSFSGGFFFQSIQVQKCHENSSSQKFSWWVSTVQFFSSLFLSTENSHGFQKKAIKTKYTWVKGSKIQYSPQEKILKHYCASIWWFVSHLPLPIELWDFTDVIQVSPTKEKPRKILLNLGNFELNR